VIEVENSDQRFSRSSTRQGYVRAAAAAVSPLECLCQEVDPFREVMKGSCGRFCLESAPCGHPLRSTHRTIIPNARTQDGQYGLMSGADHAQQRNRPVHCHERIGGLLRTTTAKPHEFFGSTGNRSLEQQNLPSTLELPANKGGDAGHLAWNAPRHHAFPLCIRGWHWKGGA
jgi:hypothetical protein